MGIQKPWSKYEAAILLDQYLKVFSGEKTRSEAISFVSNILRRIAINNGLEIDGVYRNTNGITFQMASMESAFLGRTVMKPATKLFEEIVSLYKSNFVEYKKILGEAYAQSIDKSASKEQFDNWLLLHVKDSVLPDLYSVYGRVETYMLDMGVINSPLLEITDIELIKKIQNIIKLDKGFRKAYRGKLVMAELAMQHFAQFLEESIAVTGASKVLGNEKYELNSEEMRKTSQPNSNFDDDCSVKAQPTTSEAFPETNANDEPSALSEKIRDALKKECEDNLHGTTTGYIARCIDEKDKNVVKAILTNAPWAKLKYGRWYYVTEEARTTSPHSDNNIAATQSQSNQSDKPNDECIAETAFESLFLEWLRKNGESETISKSYLKSLYSAEEYALSKKIHGISLTTLDYKLSINSIEKLLLDKAFVRYDDSLYRRYTRAFNKLKAFIDSSSSELKQQDRDSKQDEEAIRIALESHCKMKSYGTSVASLQAKLPGVSQSKIHSILKAADWAEQKNGVWFYRASKISDANPCDHECSQDEKIELVRTAFEHQCDTNPYGTTVRALHSQLKHLTQAEISSILRNSDWAEFKYGTWNRKRPKKKTGEKTILQYSDETVKRIHDEFKKQTENSAYGTTIRRMQSRLDGISENEIRAVLENSDWAVFSHGTWDYKKQKSNNSAKRYYSESEKAELVRNALMQFCENDPNGTTVTVLMANLIDIAYDEIEAILKAADWAVFQFNSWKYIKPAKSEVHQDDIRDEKDYGQVGENKNNELKKQYGSVLSQYFEDGFRIKSAIDRNRFRMYFKELFGLDLQDDDSQIVTRLKEIGEVREERVFSKNESSQNNLIEEINDYVVATFSKGASCIYVDCLFKMYQERLAEKLHVYTAESMESLLFGSGKRNYTKRYNYLCTFDKTPAANKDIIEYMKTSHIPITYAAIERDLWYIPLDKIKYTLVTTPSIVNVASESYLYAPNLPVSSQELHLIAGLISKMLLQRNYISDVELIQLIEEHCPSVLINTPDYPMWGLRNALAYLLRDDFSFRGAIISDKNSEISMAEVFADLCQRSEHITVDELRSFANELNTVIYWDSVYGEMVRINQNEFVRRDQIQFDIEQTDSVLERLIQTAYTPIKTINLFLHFPIISVPWNIFVLESYVANYSKKFRLLHASYTATDCCGAIVRMESEICDYRTLIVDVLAKNTGWKNKNDALQLLVDLGYQQRRSYSDIEKVMQEAKARMIVSNL